MTSRSKDLDRADDPGRSLDNVVFRHTDEPTPRVARAPA
jgi:hypothetical protein